MHRGPAEIDVGSMTVHEMLVLLAALAMAREDQAATGVTTRMRGVLVVSGASGASDRAAAVWDARTVPQFV